MREEINMNKYIVLNKPFGHLSQFSGEPGQLTLSSFGLPKEVYAAGRLDKDSEGLLLLSNDGSFIEQFLLNHEREYFAQVDGQISNEAINELQSGVMIKSGQTKPCSVKRIEEPVIWQRNPPIRERKNIPTSWIELILKEGKNRQVRKMTAAVGFPTLRLIRSRLGKLGLSDISLEPGSWIEVKKQDII